MNPLLELLLHKHLQHSHGVIGGNGAQIGAAPPPTMGGLMGGANAKIGAPTSPPPPIGMNGDTADMPPLPPQPPSGVGNTMGDAAFPPPQSIQPPATPPAPRPPVTVTPSSQSGMSMSLSGGAPPAPRPMVGPGMSMNISGGAPPPPTPPQTPPQAPQSVAPLPNGYAVTMPPQHVGYKQAPTHTGGGELPYQTYERMTGHHWSGGGSPEIQEMMSRLGVSGAPGSAGANLALQKALLANALANQNPLTPAQRF